MNDRSFVSFYAIMLLKDAGNDMCQPGYSRERGKTHFKVELTAFRVMRYNKIHSIKIIINKYLLCFLGWKIIFFFEKAIRQKNHWYVVVSPPFMVFLMVVF